MNITEIADSGVVFEKEAKFQIVTLVGSLSDLSLLDFSPLGLRVIKIESEEMDEFLRTTAHTDKWYKRNKGLFEEARREYVTNDEDNMYAIIPLNLNNSKTIDEQSFKVCLQVLKVMFPSVIAIHDIIHFQLFNDKYLHWILRYSYPFRKQTEYGEYLYYNLGKITQINYFIRLFAERYSKLKYLIPTLDSYTASFEINALPMQYISLCICLETIVNGKEELSYRIKRNVAILCGEDVSTSQLIYNNVGKLYQLRSTMVHTGNYKYPKILEYMPYLQALASKLIVEIILHNVKDVDELNLKATMLGFGDSQKLSEGYSPLSINANTDFMILSKELSKP